MGTRVEQRRREGRSDTHADCDPQQNLDSCSPSAQGEIAETRLGRAVRAEGVEMWGIELAPNHRINQFPFVLLTVPRAKYAHDC
jgi:hypothetical protein